MTSRPTPVNLPHSVHDRLLALARSRGRPFGELLQYFTMERFLYRLAASEAGAHFVLKGALLMVARAGLPYRPTRDIDLLGRSENSESTVAALLQGACRTPVPDDGLQFDAESLATEPIREGADYAGVRARFTSHLGSARIAMQVDVGFGDAVTPAPREIEYPVLLDFPAPRLRAYSLETTVAEKFQAMVYLGELNSRMKDFFDIWILCRQSALRPQILRDAIVATFARRKTTIPEAPVCFSADFARIKQTHWVALLRRIPGTHAPGSLADAIREILVTLEPALRDIQSPPPPH